METKKINISIDSLCIGDDYPVRLMGVINISSESFYKDSVVAFADVPAQATAMIEQGAVIIDIGGRSTAPNAGAISVEEEKKRVTQALVSLFEGCGIGRSFISIDTQYVEVGKAAFAVFEKYGKADRFICNDVSCLAADDAMAAWLAEIDVPAIIMAGHNVPGDSLGIEQTIEDLKRGIEKLDKSGYKIEEKLIVDPAIGHWIPQKSTEYDLEIVKSLQAFRILNKPILVGISRKSFIGSVTGAKDPGQRLPGTLGATAIAVFNGAHVVRTHDVNRETIEVIAIASAIKNAGKK